MSRTAKLLILAFAGVAVATALVTFLLVSVFERQQEARVTFRQIVDIPPGEPDPAVWGQNFPQEYESWLNTMKTTEFTQYSKYGRYGGSEAFQRLDKFPNYVKLFAGYPFSIDYKEDRGHANALQDMLDSERLGDQKPGSCMTCKSPQVPLLMQQLGTEQFYATPVKTLVEQYGVKHSINCADCHDSETLALKVTRPAFVEAMAARGIDVNQATRQQMRTYVCAQCHDEYYFRGQNKTVVLPMAAGVQIENIEQYYEQIQFSDWTHAESGAPIVKMQHPDYELFSTGIHYRSGVACADCHMPYERIGSTKYASHWVNTPLAHVNTSCQTCHRQTEEELRGRVIEIQDRTYHEMKNAEEAIIACIDAIKAASDAGVPADQLAEARAFHRRASMRWDFISSENSMGFHSPQEAVRILGDASNFARQGQFAAYSAQMNAGR